MERELTEEGQAHPGATGSTPDVRKAARRVAVANAATATPARPGWLHYVGQFSARYTLLLVLGVQHGGAWSWLTTVVAAGSLLAALAANLRGREGWAFIGTFVTIAMAVATYFLLLFPNVMPSTLNEAWSLTVDNASSTDYTLKIMTVVALVFTPIVLLYQSWTYWVFRKRIGTQHIPAASEPVALSH